VRKPAKICQRREAGAEVVNGRFYVGGDETLECREREIDMFDSAVSVISKQSASEGNPLWDNVSITRSANVSSASCDGQCLQFAPTVPQWE